MSLKNYFFRKHDNGSWWPGLAVFSCSLLGLWEYFNFSFENIVCAHFKNVDHVTVDVVLSYRGSQRLIERRGMTSCHHGSTISGWQQNQRWRQKKENGKKSKRFLLTKQQICTCITLFCTFLCRRCTPATWNFLISHSRFMKSVLSFCSSRLRYVLSDSARENFANICQFNWN